MLKLRSSPTSPFGRKIKVAALFTVVLPTPTKVGFFEAGSVVSTRPVSEAMLYSKSGLVAGVKSRMVPARLIEAGPAKRDEAPRVRRPEYSTILGSMTI